MTTSPVFVIPFEMPLLEELSGQRIMIRTSSSEDIQSVSAVLPQMNCRLDAVSLEIPADVTSLPFHESWKSVPLMIQAPGLGRVSQLLKHLPIIRQMSIRIMLPSTGDINYISLRILSSLGIPSGLLLEGDSADWDQLLDLATYYYFNIMGHAPIAPFDTFAERYVPGAGAPFGSTYLDEPDFLYLHLNNEGNVALSREEMEHGDFLCRSPHELSDSMIAEGLKRRSETWKRTFMDHGPCSTCPGWKICRGRIAAEDGSIPNGCGPFFDELMGMIEEFQALREGRVG